MKENNPFTLSFGRMPAEYVSRFSLSDEIIESFRADRPPNQVFMITGIRGSGKTVTMAQIANTLSKREEWVVIELSPERDMLSALASGLYESSLHLEMTGARIDLSQFGVGVSVAGAPGTMDIGTAVGKLLKVLKQSEKRLLVTVDEAVNNKNVREFVSMFQIYMRQEYPVFLLMTGLYDNIYNLQNVRTLTFLYRAPKIPLKSLNYTAMADRYRRVFGITEDAAREMASLTKGYPFAFQVLGYLRWEGGPEKAIEELIPDYDQYLEEYVYEKIWSELSATDKRIVRQMVRTGSGIVTELRKGLRMKPEQFSVYRKRLLNKGIITAPEYGVIALALPRFDHFVSMEMDA